MLSGRILIVGGAGFLGRGILRKAQREKWPANFTVYSRDEHKHVALRARYPYVRTVLGDCTDQERLEAVMTGHDTVIHAAALKHIPEAERDVSQAITVNVDGSMAVARAAIHAGVSKVVGISTDKACSPRNTYGATKMLMERAFQEFARLAPGTDFATVRYGNVVSSTGSVVPLFRSQIRENGHVKITALEMTRFWLPIDEAVDLISYAVKTATHGDIIVARCPSMKVTDVARAASLMEEIGDDRVDVDVIGTRPGEKLHEVLVDAYEAPYAFTTAQGYVCIPAATSLAGEGVVSHPMPYVSSHPDRWMTPPEFVDLIRDADLV